MVEEHQGPALSIRYALPGRDGCGPVLFVFVVLPIVEWTVNGRPMSYAELWKSGAGLAFGLFLFLLMIGAWGLAARNLRSRWALVAAPTAPYVRRCHS